VEKLHLEIVAPERVLMRQDVDMVEAPGAAGDFGVLPGHAAFLSTLEHGEIRVMADGASRFIATSGGFAEIVDNNVVFLLDTAEFAEEVDLTRAQRARERAEAALKDISMEQEEYYALQAALMRAITRISVASKTGG
jgi:F-type H+-transporting ATPase subunit epsilon